MVKKSFSRYAPRPWGMQPNTSPAADFPRSPWASRCSCLFAAYYTTFSFYTFLPVSSIGKQQKQRVKTTSSFSPRNLAALLNRRACCPPQKKLFLQNLPTLHVLHVLHGYNHFVYFVVQIFASFAFFAAEDFTLLNQFYSSSDSSRRASFRAGFLRVSSTAYTFTKPSDSL